MSSVSSAVQVLSSLSLLPANASSVTANATPAQLSAIAQTNVSLQEDAVLFGFSANTTDSASEPDSVTLSNAVLQSIDPAAAAAASSSTSSTDATTAPGSAVSLLA